MTNGYRKSLLAGANRGYPPPGFRKNQPVDIGCSPFCCLCKVIAIFGMVLIFPAGSFLSAAKDAGENEAHPLSVTQRAALRKKWESVVKEQTQKIANNPRDLRAYSLRGDALFFLGRFGEAVADYNKMIELNPKLAASHWRRGIACFYAGQYKAAAKQFEDYHTFDNVDRENGIWRYFSQAKAYGLPTARKNLLRYTQTDREPFGDVYRLFAGKIAPAQILRNIAAAQIDETEREKRLFYAHLYIGLNAALEGKRDAALKHLREAVANTWGPKAGFGPNYMWHVGRLHYELLLKQKKRKQQKSR